MDIDAGILISAGALLVAVGGYALNKQGHERATRDDHTGTASSISAMNVTVQSIKEDTSELKREIRYNREDISGLKLSMARIESRMDVGEDRLSDHDRQLTSLSGQVGDLYTALANDAALQHDNKSKQPHREDE